jgi:hypothetical protein
VLASVLPSIRKATFFYLLAIFNHFVGMPLKKGLKGL